MASAKQLESRLEKLSAKIEKQQNELAGLKARKQKVKSALANAKKAAKAKGKARK